MRYIAIYHGDVRYFQLLNAKTLQEKAFIGSLESREEAETFFKLNGYTKIGDWVQSPEYDFLWLAEVEGPR